MLVFDSSIVIEMVKDNKEVIKKYKEEPLVTINLIYGEVYYYYIRWGLNLNEFNKINFKIIDYNLEDIKNAMKLLNARKKEKINFSFIDAMIYTVAVNNGLNLVTKDTGFKGLPNVEFIN